MTNPLGSTGQQPQLVYHRIAENRRRTALLLLIFTVALLPVAFWVFSFVSPLMTVISLAEQSSSQFDSVQRQLELERQRDARFVDADPPALEDGLSLADLAKAGVVTLVVIAVVTLLHYQLATGQVLRRANARSVGRHEEPLLWRTIENLCIGAGLPLPRIYVVETPAVNAFAAGLNPEHAIVAVTRGLLDLMDRQELEGVIAHELAHIGNRDIRVNTLAAALARTLELPLQLRSFGRRGAGAVGEGQGLPGSLQLGILLMAGLIGLVTLSLSTDLFGADALEVRLWAIGITLPVYLYWIAPHLGIVLRLAVSRQREYLADADGVLLTRYPAGLARALAKIDGASDRLALVGGVPAHLYIGDPTSAELRAGGSLFSTHPPIEQRIALLAAMDPTLTEDDLVAARAAGTTHAFRAAGPPAAGATPRGVPVPPVDDWAVPAGFQGDGLTQRPGEAARWPAVATATATEQLVTPLAGGIPGSAPRAWQSDVEPSPATGRQAGRWGRGPSARPVSAPPVARPMMTVDAFRVGEGGATVLVAARATATPVAQLSAGAIVTVLGVEGGFSRVMTADDRIGYIAAGAALDPVGLIGDSGASGQAHAPGQ